MPPPLKRFLKDPNGLNRGEGVYYRRNQYYKGRNFGLRGYFSKYSIERDRKKKSSGFKVNLVGVPKRSRLLHTSDGRLPK